MGFFHVPVPLSEMFLLAFAPFPLRPPLPLHLVNTLDFSKITSSGKFSLMSSLEGSSLLIHPEVLSLIALITIVNCMVVWLFKWSSISWENTINHKLLLTLKHRDTRQNPHLGEAQRRLPAPPRLAQCRCGRFVCAWPAWRSACMSSHSGYSCKVWNECEQHDVYTNWNIL